MRVGESFCPGIVHAVAAKDGLLMRIRVPGGLIGSAQLRALGGVAAEFAGGELEITSRANVQLRGLREQDRGQLASRLAEAGFLPSVAHERVRNIAASPLAGWDGTELIDTRALVAELDARLTAEPRFAGLPAKFGFGLDGGGRRFSAEVDDVALVAVDARRLQLMVGGVDSGFAVAVEDAAECLLQAASACMVIADEAGVSARGRALVKVAGAVERVVAACTGLSVSEFAGVRAVEGTPLGAFAGRLGVNLVPSVQLGRLTAEQAMGLAEFGFEVRLAPWRGVVVGELPTAAVGGVQIRLEGLGLACDGRDGFAGVAACAGSSGCDASIGDVRGDAAVVAGRLAGRDIRTGWTVNFCGCEKRCAMRHGASAELVALEGGGYRVRLAGEALELDRAAALGLVTADALGECA